MGATNGGKLFSDGMASTLRARRIYLAKAERSSVPAVVLFSSAFCFVFLGFLGHLPVSFFSFFSLSLSCLLGKGSGGFLIPFFRQQVLLRCCRCR